MICNLSSVNGATFAHLPGNRLTRHHWPPRDVLFLEKKNRNFWPGDCATAAKRFKCRCHSRDRNRAVGQTTTLLINIRYSAWILLKNYILPDQVFLADIEKTAPFCSPPAADANGAPISKELLLTLRDQPRPKYLPYEKKKKKGRFCNFSAQKRSEELWHVWKFKMNNLPDPWKWDLGVNQMGLSICQCQSKHTRNPENKDQVWIKSNEQQTLNPNWKSTQYMLYLPHM